MDDNKKQDKQLSPGVRLEWQHGGRVFHFKLTDTNPNTIDVYIDANLEIIQEWKPGQLFLNVQDISADGMTLTPYFKKRLNEVAEQIVSKQLRGYSAVIMPKTFMAVLFTTFGQVFSRRMRDGVQQMYFTDLDEGIAWVERHLEPTSVSG